MSEPFVFDPRCPVCKLPYGAVPCGTEVTLHVRPLHREGFTRCTLLLHREFAALRQELPLSPDGRDGERDRFSLTFPAPEEGELCWYCFRLSRPDGSGCLLDRSGYRSEGEAQCWQLTVYDAEQKTPQWFGEGITYQIFPDRFRRLSLPDPTGLPGDRRVHESWEELPDWRPDPDGEIRNRDFFGGSLTGIREKLPYLHALGVTTLYLCPIFEAASNHRYDTADYRRIDPMLGTEEDFRGLCDAAHSLGMRILLDGVFNHTGSDSRYFNAKGSYPEPGAAQSKDSPYYNWYTFRVWPTDYECWWGIRTLPTVNKEAPSYRDFLFEGEDSVVRHWLRAGADGWRLDVADELPDGLIADIRRAAEETKPGSLLLGEVWEDGSNKIAYSRRRRYLLGHETHGLMNYPFRTAALRWLTGGDAAEFCEAMETLRENYPAPAFFSAMNFLGTHDTPRILTLLGASSVPENREARAAYRLSPEEYRRGAERLRLGAVLLYAFPGSPTVLYGDECGMQGFEDPFNRGGYPWGRENSGLLAHFTRLGQLRQQRPSLRRGELRWLRAEGPELVFLRETAEERTFAALNAGDAPRTCFLPWGAPAARDLLSGQVFPSADGVLKLTLPRRTGMLLEELPER